MNPDQQSNLVPGVLRCAKCNFSLQRTNLYIKSGTTGAGSNETEPCPNGCGPLWPVTWEQEAKECWKHLSDQAVELQALRTSQTPESEVIAKQLRNKDESYDALERQFREFRTANKGFLDHCYNLIQRMMVELKRSGHGIVNGIAWHSTKDCEVCKLVKEAEDTLK